MGLLSVGCYEKVVDRDSDDVKKRVADASIAFQANHDGDRREEIRYLYPRTPIGATEAEVREFLGDPSPGISDAKKWAYDLGGQDTVTLYFEDGLLKSKHWLTAPEEIVVQASTGKAVSPDDDSPNKVESQQKPEVAEPTAGEGTGSGPTVSTGTSRP